MASPIQQELIDGKCYWDPIGTKDLPWLRLIELPSRDSMGHYKYSIGGTWPWTATSYGRNHLATGKTDQRGFQTGAEARQWIEERYRSLLDQEKEDRRVFNQ